MATHKYPPARVLAAMVLFGIAVGAVTYAVFHLAHWPFGLSHVGVLCFWTLLSAALQVWQEEGLIRDPKGFIVRFMLGLVIKLLVAIGAIAVLLFLLPRHQALPMALLCIGLYLSFLAFSTIRLSARARHSPRT